MNKKIIFADQIIVSSSTIAFNYLIAYFFGNKALGNYATLFIVNICIASIFYASFSSHLLFWMNDKKECRNYYTASIFFQVILLFSIFLIFYFLMVLFDFFNFNFDFFICSVFYIVFFILFDFNKKMIMVRGGAIKNLYLDIFNVLLIFLMIIFLYFCGEYSENKLIIVFSASYMLLFFISSFFIGYRKIKKSYLKKYLLAIFDYSKWAVPAAMISWLGESFLTLSYGRINGVEELGKLRLIQNTFSIFNPILVFIENTRPILYKNFRSAGENLALKVRKDIFLAMSVCALSVLVVGCFLMMIKIDKLNGQELSVVFYFSTYILIFSVSFKRCAIKSFGNLRPLLISNLIAGFFSLSIAKILMTFGILGFVGSIFIYNLILFVALSYFFLETRGHLSKPHSDSEARDGMR